MTSREFEMAEFPEMNPGPVLRMDRAGSILLANRAARELFGRPQLVGLAWGRLCPGMDPSLWDRTLKGKEGVHHETDLNGRRIAFTFAHPPGSDLVFAYGADITRLKEAERELARQAAELAEMARFPEMNPGPVCRLDRESRVVLANRAARDLFLRDDLDGASWVSVCPGMTPSLWERILTSSARTMHEARLGNRDLLFTHTPGAEDGHIFVYGADLTDEKAAERVLRQTEKMATLGTLAAGVAHELNNPAAAAQRAAEQLQQAFAALQQAQLRLGRRDLDADEADALAGLDRQARDQASCPCELAPVARSDLEADVEAWLADLDIEEPWELAPDLVNLGHDRDSLTTLAGRFRADRVPDIVTWLSRTYPVYSLLEEIRQGAGRLVEIVTALKAYSYVGQAPVQAVDVNEGLKNTLVILRAKLKRHITVEQRLTEDLPRIQAHGSELNQVWTNIIDNAADAMRDGGHLVIRTSRDDDWLIVEVEDNGPGIPAEIQSQVFDAFFTTKPPGQGTGLGLNTSYKIIVQRHGGRIDVESRPGKTRFVVRLPLIPRAHRRLD